MARIELADHERRYIERARGTLAAAVAFDLSVEEPNAAVEADRMVGRLEVVVEGLLCILDGKAVA